MVVVQGTAQQDRTTYNDAQAFSDPLQGGYYITAAWGEEEVYTGSVPASIVVGNGESYTVSTDGQDVVYTNVPLSSNTEHTLFTRYDIRNDDNSGVGLQILCWAMHVEAKFTLLFLGRSGSGWIRD